ncbi:MAG: hypothetical protein AB7L84_11380 [Acidimicrobiia bacterium]
MFDPVRVVEVVHRSAAVRDRLDELAVRVRPVTLAREQRLPVVAALAGLVPHGGLRRGTTVAVGATAGATGATSLALALAAGPSAAGSWVAAVGLGALGLAAAAEMGVALERTVLVAAPHPGSWAEVVAALVDGFDLVLVRPVRGIRPAEARRLAGRARDRGAVLVQVADRGSGPLPPGDLVLRVVASSWEGLEAVHGEGAGGGYGHLAARRVTVAAGGRGEASMPRQADLWLPGRDGRVGEVLDPPTPLRRRGVAR